MTSVSFENILYEFNGVTGEAVSQGDPREEDAMEGAYTNIVEIAQVVTEGDLGADEGPVLLTAPAADLSDGLTFEAAGTTYEMNTGPVANLELEDGEFSRCCFERPALDV